MPVMAPSNDDEFLTPEELLEILNKDEEESE